MELSPSARRVRDIALEHFAEHGYDGSSLSTIAASAGIRKASLYSHFAGKDALFSAVLAHCVVTEQHHATDVFQSDTAEFRGHAYLATIGERYLGFATLRCLLRAAYAPPAAMRGEAAEQHRAFLSHVSGLFEMSLQRVAPNTSATLVQGYLGIVDALHVEAIFGEPHAVDLRLRALWRMMEHFAFVEAPRSAHTVS